MPPYLGSETRPVGGLPVLGEQARATDEGLVDHDRARVAPEDVHQWLRLKGGKVEDIPLGAVEQCVNRLVRHRERQRSRGAEEQAEEGEQEAQSGPSLALP